MTNAHLEITLESLLLKMTYEKDLKTVITNSNFITLLESLRKTDAFSHTLSKDISDDVTYRATHLLRKLKTAYAMPAFQLFSALRQLSDEIAKEASSTWKDLAQMASESSDGRLSITKLLLKFGNQTQTKALIERLEKEDPHAIYPTSSYRTSQGTVNSNEDGSYIEAVMTTSTMTEIHITDGVLEHDNHLLSDLYQPLGRCICVLDSNVSEHYEDEIKAYFDYHHIELTLLVYRAMEVDKGIAMVESLMADFKKVGVSRQEPVLIVGGGVIADTGGLACALYHRSTPYVMLATSIVSGIDAGPSPRTCCDGFGFKNLFGAYHAPVMTLTDRTFFKTLRTGWIRHGIAEIIKMAVVKDVELFKLLEDTGIELLYSQFGTVTNDQSLQEKGQRILSLAMRSYVQSEYGNLYETHQCRPHAYGHTWSPGFEIPSGMLHGHAVACGMGFGAYLSYKQGWISTEDRDRILQLISDFELSLWHPILDDTDLIYKAQVKVIEKRGGNLVAPLPKGKIGECGYLNELTLEQMKLSIEEYKAICKTYARAGFGVEPLCEDVGLEDPSTVAHSSTKSEALQNA
ncbi:MAG: sedoheptulose 7-phosphate cyclase [Psychroserpens sp.]|uniref:sedoheptulose 7-phosphate cyclase n=1 Tax=Psychroserpens sp. TaxID=2020870 RepID=UPI003CB103AC